MSQGEIIDELKKENGLTRVDLINRTNRSWGTTNLNLKKLREQGLTKTEIDERINPNTGGVIRFCRFYLVET